jgi:hypothetical protein
MKLFFLIFSLLTPITLYATKDEIPYRVYPVSYDVVWPLLLREISSYELLLANKITGQIKTRWIDNTEARNFLFDDDVVLASKFNLLIQANPVLNTTTPAVKITIFKQQMVMVNESQMSWEVEPSDSIDEETLFYRIGRAIDILK